jgi:putative DNA methylase
MLKKSFDISSVTELVLHEKKIQDNYRPIIAVHKWFARRPPPFFRSLLLSEFSSLPLREALYRTNHLENLRVAYPFKGGGTPVIGANRMVCAIMGNGGQGEAEWER